MTSTMKVRALRLSALGFRCRLYYLTVLLCALPVSGSAAERLTLDTVLHLLDAHNPSLAGAQARRDSARAALVTARAYPNPELQGGGGASRGIGPGAFDGANGMLGLSQPIDLPFVREARRKVADAGIVSADEASRAIWLSIRSQTRLAYYDILRRQAELEIARDNERLLGQIRDRVKVKVEVGEAAKYEAVKAEAELLNAVKLRESAAVRVDDAKSALRALFGPALPSDFDAQGDLPELGGELPPLPALHEKVLGQQPALQYIRAEVQKADAKLRLEEKMRYPVPTLTAGVERDPGLEQWRLGISLPLPLWNQRQGPIGEAAADLRQVQAQASQQELTVLRELENAYNRYRIAHRQVETFENGLLKEAENALKVAEAAYRLGERGILDYLDAQRTYRGVRSDHLNARFDRQNAMIEIERLTASDLKELRNEL
jgi:cobalt-zinc-cadmium efflux system outer membrane protein